MATPTLKSLKHLLLAAGLGLGSLGIAQAGVVSGSWDPLFGAPLTNLSWSGEAKFWVPDACSAQTDGIYSISGACSGTYVDFAKVKFFDAGTDPVGTQVIDFAALSPTLTPTQVKVYNNQVVAVGTNLVVNPSPVSAPAAQGNLFGLQFSVSSPNLVCILCSPTGPNINNGNVIASVAGMEQTFYSFTDTGAPKLVDANHNPVGVILNGSGGFVAYTSPPVPEPGTWALMLGGLAAVSLRLRRRR